MPDEHDLPGMDPAGLQEFLSPEPIPTVLEGVMNEREKQILSPLKMNDQPSPEEIQRPVNLQDETQQLHETHPPDTTLWEGNL